jgi:hypothetical protein
MMNKYEVAELKAKKDVNVRYIIKENEDRKRKQMEDDTLQQKTTKERMHRLRLLSTLSKQGKKKRSSNAMLRLKK